jgi:THO complex subunit 2
LFQYLELLQTPSAVSLDEYAKMLPSVTDLVSLYGVSVSVAMQVLRPLLNDAVLVRGIPWLLEII